MIKSFQNKIQAINKKLFVPTPLDNLNEFLDGGFYKDKKYLIYSYGGKSFINHVFNRQNELEKHQFIGGSHSEFARNSYLFVSLGSKKINEFAGNIIEVRDDFHYYNSGFNPDENFLIFTFKDNYLTLHSRNHAIKSCLL